jgi:hypothetical protein
LVGLGGSDAVLRVVGAGAVRGLGIRSAKGLTHGVAGSLALMALPVVIKVSMKS